VKIQNEEVRCGFELVMASHFVSSVILLVGNGQKYKYELRNHKGIALIDSHPLLHNKRQSNPLD
jgi:hypothetical protein